MPESGSSPRGGSPTSPFTRGLRRCEELGCEGIVRRAQRDSEECARRVQEQRNEMARRVQESCKERARRWQRGCKEKARGVREGCKESAGKLRGGSGTGSAGCPRPVPAGQEAPGAGAPLAAPRPARDGGFSAVRTRGVRP